MPPIHHKSQSKSQPFFVPCELSLLQKRTKMIKKYILGSVKSNKQKLKKGANIKTLDSNPGLYTRYKPFLQRDKNFVKKLMLGVKMSRPYEVQSALLKRHLLELTSSFTIPLERYLASLMPLQKNISPYKVRNTFY